MALWLARDSDGSRLLADQGLAFVVRPSGPPTFPHEILGVAEFPACRQPRGWSATGVAERGESFSDLERRDFTPGARPFGPGLTTFERGKPLIECSGRCRTLAVHVSLFEGIVFEIVQLRTRPINQLESPVAC